MHVQQIGHRCRRHPPIPMTGVARSADLGQVHRLNGSFLRWARLEPPHTGPSHPNANRASVDPGPSFLFWAGFRRVLNRKLPISPEPQTGYCGLHSRPPLGSKQLMPPQWAIPRPRPAATAANTLTRTANPMDCYLEKPSGYVSPKVPTSWRTFHPAYRGNPSEQDSHGSGSR